MIDSDQRLRLFSIGKSRTCDWHTVFFSFLYLCFLVLLPTVRTCLSSSTLQERNSHTKATTGAMWGCVCKRERERESLLDLIASLPCFVPLLYQDSKLPHSHGQLTSSCYILSLSLSLLDLTEGKKPHKGYCRLPRDLLYAQLLLSQTKEWLQFGILQI